MNVLQPLLNAFRMETRTSIGGLQTALSEVRKELRAVQQKSAQAEVTSEALAALGPAAVAPANAPSTQGPTTDTIQAPPLPPPPFGWSAEQARRLPEPMDIDSSEILVGDFPPLKPELEAALSAPAETLGHQPYRFRSATVTRQDSIKVADTLRPEGLETISWANGRRDLRRVTYYGVTIVTDGPQSRFKTPLEVLNAVLKKLGFPPLDSATAFTCENAARQTHLSWLERNRVLGAMWAMILREECSLRGAPLSGGEYQLESSLRLIRDNIQVARAREAEPPPAPTHLRGGAPAGMEPREGGSSSSGSSGPSDHANGGPWSTVPAFTGAGRGRGGGGGGQRGGSRGGGSSRAWNGRNHSSGVDGGDKPPPPPRRGAGARVREREREREREVHPPPPPPPPLPPPPLPRLPNLPSSPHPSQ